MAASVTATNAAAIALVSAGGNTVSGILCNTHATVIVYIGDSTSMATDGTNGVPLPAGAYLPFTITGQAVLYGKSSGADVVVANILTGGRY